MIVDTHTHIFPDQIAEKAARSISKFYDLDMRGDGRLETLLSLEKQAGVDRVVVCAAATTATQTRHVNDYLAQTVRAHPNLLTGLGAMHQDFPDKPEELDRMLAMGLKGVKIHPDIQGVALNDRRYDELYEAISQRGAILLAHTGDLRYDNSNPPEILDVLARFPRLTIICAHLGSWSNWTEGVKWLAGRENVYVDCSSSLYALSPEKARAIIRAFGCDRVMFGSDFPMWSPVEERKRLDAVGLNAGEMEKVLGLTARRLFHLE